jgi:hypothetical protein
MKLYKYISESNYQKVNAIPIPEKPTNLDVLKSLFPNCDIEDVGFGELMLTINNVSISDFRMIFSKDWARAKYEGVTNGR